LQFVQRGSMSLPALAPSKKGFVAGLIEGMGFV
jgi:hypothetical protein